MWCKTCNIETNESICPICKSNTIEDLPVEVYWCKECKVPIIKQINQSDKEICPICRGKLDYLSKDIRPVFPEERLLIELLLEKEANSLINSSVWASDSKYFIDGKKKIIQNKTFNELKPKLFKDKLNKYQKYNSYENFNRQISKFITANKFRFLYLVDEANEFIKKISEKYEEEKSIYMQLISSGPNYEFPVIRDNHIKLIQEAKKSVFIQTPYFVPDDLLLDTLKTEAITVSKRRELTTV